MTEDGARQALAARFISVWEAAHPTYEIFVEGISEPDLTTQELPFARLNVGLPRIEQAELAQNPSQRFDGFVEIGLFVPQGQGTKKLFDMLTTVRTALAVQTVSGIRLYEATPTSRQPAVGWQAREVLVRYSFDSNT